MTQINVKIKDYKFTMRDWNIVSIAKVGASQEILDLVEIIERLIGEVIPAADQKIT